MELRERLQGQPPGTSSAARSDGFAELKDRIHLAVISDLGPRLYNESLTTTSLHRVVVATCATASRQERGLAIADRDRLVQEIADDILGHGPIEPLLHDDTVSEVMVNGPPTSGSSAPACCTRRR